MFIEKPRVPEELYKFFIKGMLLKPIPCNHTYDYRRKGWNVYTHFVRFSTNPSIGIKFYSYNSSYYPDWELEVYQYVIPKTN
jgi:hypothetical protein